MDIEAVKDKNEWYDRDEWSSLEDMTPTPCRTRATASRAASVASTKAARRVAKASKETAICAASAGTRSGTAACRKEKARKKVKGKGNNYYPDYDKNYTNHSKGHSKGYWDFKGYGGTARATGATRKAKGDRSPLPALVAGRPNTL